MTAVREDVLKRAEELLPPVEERTMPLSFQDIPMSRMVCDDDKVEKYEENVSRMEAGMPVGQGKGSKIPYLKKLIADQNEINRRLIFVWKRSIELSKEREALEKRAEALMIDLRRKDR